MAAGENRYFTGKPCVKGHTVERYVLNGACTACISANNATMRESANLRPSERRAAIAQLVDVGMRLFHTDVPAFGDAVLALVQSQYPNLERQDVVRGKPTGVAAGTGFYPFRIRGQDLEILRAVAAAYCSAHSPNFEALRQKNLDKALEVAAKQRDNGAGEWKFT